MWISEPTSEEPGKDAYRRVNRVVSGREYHVNGGGIMRALKIGASFMHKTSPAQTPTYSQERRELFTRIHVQITCVSQRKRGGAAGNPLFLTQICWRLHTALRDQENNRLREV